ncbi:transmembrane protein, putative (macronuclear) [Tetrahymena thermophila SB210]|uniref:Transmembrane protein, putative n=1 Tax=Tetrahymena thermophila (strain SB210) TaxID=312017 RepID=A4VDC1_TETTS|nr:transmembrane protein, putative [Tetrahymena thermophila SB210]EDK31526.2 transmembrane protein, putative [Tetrahymena thermophila SB210]|eukprot:XP_001470906.2 transmembrane protein, putative [Tetrahymena thermophila SB210]
MKTDKIKRQKLSLLLMILLIALTNCFLLLIRFNCLKRRHETLITINTANKIITIKYYKQQPYTNFNSNNIKSLTIQSNLYLLFQTINYHLLLIFIYLFSNILIYLYT